MQLYWSADVYSYEQVRSWAARISLSQAQLADGAYKTSSIARPTAALETLKCENWKMVVIIRANLLAVKIMEINMNF